MDHWPDIDRCKRLKKAKYPQGKTMFNYVCVGESWILDLTKKGDGLQRCAAPLADELTEEIMKMIPVPSGDCAGDSMLIVHVFEDGCRVVVPTQTLKRIEAGADTLPNALADLWLWLRGRES